ncbi:hypothetical protein TVNIR_1133 [Thioalkalivibrio nitratireducens DSM 14787]|uniref:Uncharacterized protein n=1 Tax=Thioalkalivibrio nitratireducens (strain DSM 14787 / UNIQEM 213 / ALEN2) TaxID=1255043 RepID=L0DUZ0_THIND|nr:hypothetical protein TVNIR_1133 [Thioalkalivibrio nitratireducens DSM 14787]
MRFLDDMAAKTRQGCGLGASRFPWAVVSSATLLNAGPDVQHRNSAGTKA